MVQLVVAITAILAATAAPPAAFTADCAARPTTALAAALAASRGRASDTPATIMVTGTCRISEPVTLGPADDRLTIAGGGDAPTISGGIAIPSWKEHAEAACDRCGKIWVAELPAGVRDSRQFYFNGWRGNRTVMQFPQQGAARTEVGFISPIGGNWTHNGGAGIEMLHQGTSSCNESSRIQWAQHRLPVTRIDHAANLFVMVQPAFNHSNGTTKLPCYVENVFELLGAPGGHSGDYYLDIPARKVYAVSVAPPSDAVLPQSNGLFVLTNTTAVTLTGLTLSDATWLLDSDGFIQAQAGCIVKGPAGYDGGFDSWICMPGSIEVHRGRGCSFDNNAFIRLGAAGIALVDGSQANTIAGSLFYDISGTAVSIGDIASYNETDPDNHDADNTVSDCTIRDVAREYLGTCGITAFYSRGTVIEHNEVYHVPYTGISIGWGWTETMEVTWPRMPWDHGNVVRWNHVHEVDGILGDGGSIYTLGVQGNRPFRAGSVRKAYPAVPEPPLKILPMSQMVSNYAHNNGWPERPKNSRKGDGTHGPGGVYTDNGSTGWNVSGNVFKSLTVWAVACYTSGIDNNTYTNNTLISTWGPINSQPDCLVANNTNADPDALPTAAAAVIAGAGPRQQYSRFA